LISIRDFLFLSYLRQWEIGLQDSKVQIFVRREDQNDFEVISDVRRKDQNDFEVVSDDWRNEL